MKYGIMDGPFAHGAGRDPVNSKCHQIFTANFVYFVYCFLSQNALYCIQEVRKMKQILRTVAWFVIINYSVCNKIWTEPVSYWWIIEIIVLTISILLGGDN